MFGGGEMKFLKQLADRLSALYPYWDARIMDFNGLRVVAVDVFPDLSVSLYAIKSNQWLATSLMLDSEGTPVASHDPQPLGVRDRDIDGAVQAIVRALVTSYRTMAQAEGEGGLPPEMGDDLKKHAHHALARLTGERFE